MINVAIIGLGKISAPHIQGLLNNKDKYKIVAVCDIDEELKTTAKELDIPFYNNNKEVSQLENVDLVVVLTPPHTHHQIAKFALENKKHVLIEKPGVLEMPHLYDLIDTAKENDVTVDVMYHWQHGSEVYAVKDKLDTFGKLIKIESNAFDPYTLKDKKTIHPEYTAHGGAWNDSGINILSMLVKFVDITKLKLKNEYLEYDITNELPIHIKKVFNYEDIEVLINIDWRENKNHKYTNFYFEEGTLFVHHTAQEVWFDTQRIDSFYNTHRLATHYINLFKNTDLSFENINDTIELHKVLLNQK